MDKTIDNGIKTAFSYEVFDRQVGNFYRMTKVLIEGWEDYSSQEMTFDIMSLCTKASRLCFMADQDLALQHTDVTQQRKAQNEEYLAAFDMLVNTGLAKLLKSIMQGLSEGRKVEGHKSPMFTSHLSGIIPKLGDLLRMEGMTVEGMTALNDDFLQLEKDFLKKFKATQFPGVKHEERLWNLFRLYALCCYLFLHFRRVCNVTDRGMEPEEMGRLTELAVQKYIDEKPGCQRLDLYFSDLRYDNDGKPLDEECLLDARRQLKTGVPECFQLAFLHHADDARQLGKSLSGIFFSSEEYIALLDAVAKYQIITRKIYELHYPEESTHQLSNDVFYPVVNGRTVDMLELKRSITKMVALVRKKNQWFCVWSVLKHLNLIRTDSTFSAFANQMMSDDWFGDIDARRRFTGDNLSDFSHYFAEYDYKQWTKEMFQEKKELYGMTKWSDSLFDTFSALCREMEKSIWGYRFLG